MHNAFLAMKTRVNPSTLSIENIEFLQSNNDQPALSTALNSDQIIAKKVNGFATFWRRDFQIVETASFVEHTRQLTSHIFEKLVDYTINK